MLECLLASLPGCDPTQGILFDEGTWSELANDTEEARIYTRAAEPADVSSVIPWMDRPMSAKRFRAGHDAPGPFGMTP